MYPGKPPLHPCKAQQGACISAMATPCSHARAESPIGVPWAKQCVARAHSIERADHPAPALVQHMGIDHCRFNMRVANKFLYRAGIVAGLQQMGGKAMAQRMRCRWLGDPSLTHRVFIARWSTFSSAWWRRTMPERGSTDRLLEGKTCRQLHSRPACGYFRSRA